jgi:hypothetical protein
VLLRVYKSYLISRGVSSYVKYGGEFGPAVSERFDRQGARDRRTEVIMR